VIAYAGQHKQVRQQLQLIQQTAVDPADNGVCTIVVSAWPFENGRLAARGLLQRPVVLAYK
jgi:hypothetical protein